MFREIVEYRGAKRSGNRASLFSVPSDLQLLDPDNGYTKICRFFLGSMSVGKVISSGHLVDVREPQNATLLVPLQGRINVVDSRSSLSATAGELLFYSPNVRTTRVEQVGKAPFFALPLIVPHGELRDLAEANGYSSRTLSALDNFALKFSATQSAPAMELIQLVRVLNSEIERGAPHLTRPSSTASWENLLKEKMLDVLRAAEVIDMPGPVDSSSAQRIAVIAREFITANHCEIETISDIAKAAGTSIRNLQDAFHRVCEHRRPRDWRSAGRRVRHEDHPDRRHLGHADGARSVRGAGSAAYGR